MAHLPEHPIGSTVRTDEQGSYVAYHKICKNCQVELTSRNRVSGGALKCKTCQASDAKVAWREAAGWPNQMGRPRTVSGNPASEPVTKPASAPVTKAERQSEAHHTVNPERQAVHSLLTKFLLYPTHKETKDNLLDALVTYEIKDRFRFL
jgi:ribosomal protein L37AE/L43A